MARMLVTLDGRGAVGGCPLVQHNERLADPLNPFALAIGKISKKRGKAEADHLEVALLEFVGGMYHDGGEDWLKASGQAVPEVPFLQAVGTPMNRPYLPTWHVIRSIQNAGKQLKLGAAVLRGVTAVGDGKAPIQYDGPTEIDELWRAGTFALRKSVGVSSSRVMRTRPVFQEWLVEAEIEVDLNILDPHRINQLAGDAGRYHAVGDYRPVYGRFAGSAVLLDEAKVVSRKKEEVV